MFFLLLVIFFAHSIEKCTSPLPSYNWSSSITGVISNGCGSYLDPSLIDLQSVVLNKNTSYPEKYNKYGGRQYNGVSPPFFFLFSQKGAGAKNEEHLLMHERLYQNSLQRRLKLKQACNICS